MLQVMCCEGYVCLWYFISVLIFDVGLVCVCKPNASCDKCHAQRTKCEYPGKTNIGAGSGMGAGLPTKGQPIIVIPPPKHESLEVRRQEAVVQEWVNELAEVHLEVDHDMVCAMRDLTCTMGRMNMGVLPVAGVGAPGVSMGVGWSGEHEEGTSKEKGKGKERAVVEDEGEGAEGAGEGWGGLDDWTEGGGDRHDDGGDEDGCDDDAPNVEYIG